MMKPRVFIFSTFLTLAIVVASVNILIQFRVSATNEPVSGEIEPVELIKNPEPVFKPNKNIPRDKLYDISKKIDKDKLTKNNGKLEKMEVVTFGEFSRMSLKDPNDNPQISPDRLVWIVQTYFPQGYEHHKVGFIKNARSIALYDAETGEFLGSSIKQAE